MLDQTSAVTLSRRRAAREPSVQLSRISSAIPADFDLLPDAALLDDRQIAALAGVKISTVKGWRRRGIGPEFVSMYGRARASAGAYRNGGPDCHAPANRKRKRREMPPALADGTKYAHITIPGHNVASIRVNCEIAGSRRLPMYLHGSPIPPSTPPAPERAGVPLCRQPHTSHHSPPCYPEPSRGNNGFRRPFKGDPAGPELLPSTEASRRPPRWPVNRPVGRIEQIRMVSAPRISHSSIPGRPRSPIVFSVICNPMEAASAPATCAPRRRSGDRTGARTRCRRPGCLDHGRRANPPSPRHGELFVPASRN